MDDGRTLRMRWTTNVPSATQVKRIQRELEIDPELPMLDAVHAAEAMMHWDFTQLDAAPLRVRIAVERLPLWDYSHPA